MTKLFKNSKSILSFVLAFAVLAVSLFTGVVIHSDAANCDDELNVVYITYGSNATVNRMVHLWMVHTVQVPKLIHM